MPIHNPAVAAAAVNWTEYTEAETSPAAFNTWENWDLSAKGVPANALVFVHLRCAGARQTLGVRRNGSALVRSIFFLADEGQVWPVQADADGIIERYVSNVAVVGKFAVLGWIEAQP